MCQRPNPTIVELTKSPEEFHAIFSSNEFEVIDAVHINKKLDRVVYRRKAQFTIPPQTNSVHIAVFVTAHARRRLFLRIIEAVEKNLELLYCDTDSLIFKRNVNQPPIIEGP